MPPPSSAPPSSAASSAASSAGSARTTASEVRRAGNSARAIAIGALLLAAVATAVAVYFWQRTERVVQEAARRWQDAENRAGQIEQQMKLSQDQLRDLLGRSAVLENKLSESIGQQAQLERMYKNIAQDSLDNVLADVENALSIASQQLLLGANVQGALVAMQDADNTLKRADPAAVSNVRRLISRDIERLRAVPVTDVVSMMLRLDGVSANLEQFPMLAGLTIQSTPEPDPAARTDKSAASPINRLADSGLRGWNALKSELSALVRVNRVDAPDAVLLAPEQQYFVRENLRLNLLSARMALLARNDALFRGDLDRAIAWLNTYYDRQNKAVANAIASLRQLQANQVAVELPSLADSQTAVRAMRASRESRP